MRVIAVDWSGAKATSAARRAIWLAEVRDGRPIRLWSLERRRDYLDWTERVVEGCRGVSPVLERLYDERLTEGRAARLTSW